MREILKGYGGGWRATFGRENTASLSRKFERRVLNHVWGCCSAGSITGWVKRLFRPEVGLFGCANCGCGCWVSGGIDSDWYGLIASKPAPTEITKSVTNQNQTVGVSLLAMRPYQSLSTPTDTQQPHLHLPHPNHPTPGQNNLFTHPFIEPAEQHNQT